jgi:hypothetical protein
LFHLLPFPLGRPDNVGRDFIIAFSANTAVDTKNKRVLQLFLTSVAAIEANFKIEAPGNPTLLATINGSVKKGKVEMVSIPTELMVRKTEISKKGK